MQRLLQLVHEQVIWWNGWINGKCLTKAHFLGLAFMRLTSFIKACILSDFFFIKRPSAPLQYLVLFSLFAMTSLWYKRLYWFYG